MQGKSKWQLTNPLTLLLISPPFSFLDYCFLCNQKLSPAKDIYMYKGDKVFCSEECRCRQIFKDEEEASSFCSTTSSSSGSCTREYENSTPSPSSSRRPSGGKGGSGRRNAFAY